MMPRLFHSLRLSRWMVRVQRCLCGSVGQFLQSLRSAHRVLIEATFYQEGNRVIQFATQGLEWESTKEERAYATGSKMAAARRAANARCQSRASTAQYECVTHLGDCVRAYEGTGPHAETSQWQ